MGTDTRICSRCRDERPTKDFTIHTECKDGRTYICYSCEKKRRSKYYGYEFGDIRRNTDYSLTIFKACPKCNFLLSIDDFGKDKNRADKHQSYCKECKKKYDAKDYKKHFNKRAESALVYYEENRDRISVHGKKYRDREDVKIRMREYNKDYK